MKKALTQEGSPCCRSDQHGCLRSWTAQAMAAVYRVRSGRAQPDTKWSNSAHLTRGDSLSVTYGRRSWVRAARPWGAVVTTGSRAAFQEEARDHPEHHRGTG